MEGSLASVRTWEASRELIKATKKASKRPTAYWLGAQKKGRFWVWTLSGKKVAKKSWANGYPKRNTRKKRANCAALYTKKQVLLNQSCKKKMKFVC